MNYIQSPMRPSTQPPVQSPEQPIAGEYFEQEIHLRDYFRILWIRRWLVLTGFVAVVLAAIWYVKTTDPVYESEVVLYYEKDNSQNFLIESLTQGAGVQALEVEAQKEFLTGPAVLGDVIRQLRVEAVLKFTPEEIENLEEALDITSPRGSNLLKLTARADSPRKAQLLAALAARSFTDARKARKTKDLVGALSYLRTQITTVEAELGKAEQELNRFRTQEGIFGSESARPSLSGAVSYSLLDQLANLQRKQTNAEMEKALAESQVETLQRQIKETRQQLDPNDVMSSMSTSGLPPQLEQYQKKVVELQIALDSALDTYTAQAPEVVELQQQLDAAQKRLDTEVQNLMDANRNSIDPLNELKTLTAQVIAQSANVGSLKRKEEFYKTKVAEFNKQHPELVNKEVELMRLERRKRQYEETYAFLVQKQKETELLQQMETSDFDVYKPATFPEAPVKPRTKMTLALATVLGLMLGIGAAFFLEYMDDTVKTREQVERILGLPVVGSIPKVTVTKATREAVQAKVEELVHRPVTPAVGEFDPNGAPMEIVGQERRERSKNYRKRLEELLARTLPQLEPKSQAVESYRILRANVQFANVDDPPRVILVVSSTPGEGKTLTACNLAISLAETGMKILLVDCDLRRPRVHLALSLDRAPGLTDFLVSRETSLPEWLTRPAEIPNLTVITCGSRSPNPAELLGSQKMRALLKALHEQYDLIILDSPPVISVADSSILAREVDSILMVVRTGQVKERAVEQARDVLFQTNASIFGVVLNDVDYTKQYGAYYYYYHYYYRQYYSPDDDELV